MIHVMPICTFFTNPYFQETSFHDEAEGKTVARTCFHPLHSGSRSFTLAVLSSASGLGKTSISNSACINKDMGKREDHQTNKQAHSLSRFLLILPCVCGLLPQAKECQIQQDETQASAAVSST